MGATLDALLKLQEIEKQLVEYRRGIESRRRQIRGATRRMQKALQEHQETLARIRDKQTHADALDLEIKSRDAQTARLREALNRAKREPFVIYMMSILGDVSLALPFSSVMSKAQVDRVCQVLHKAVS